MVFLLDITLFVINEKQDHLLLSGYTTIKLRQIADVHSSNSSSAHNQFVHRSHNLDILYDMNPKRREEPRSSFRGHDGCQLLNFF